MNSRSERFRSRVFVSFVLFCLFVLTCLAQPPKTLIYEWGTKSFNPAPRAIRGTELSPAQWRDLIDRTWGPAKESPAQQVRVFDIFWSAVDSKFACFPGLNLDWDAVRERYRPEIEKGVSRGRLSAILDHAALALMDGGHTYADYAPVHLDTEAVQGVPLLLVGWRDQGRFGAGLTPLPDGRLLVYKAHPGNPLGLKAGDVVLGYEGKLWKEIYPRLIAAELPIVGKWGTAPTAHEHIWLAAAGLNWHLFETIDVLKYDTKEVVHITTACLSTQPAEELFASEQLPVAGVPCKTLKEIYAGETVAWGKVEGTDIGYIYVWRWAGKTDDLFEKAAKALMTSTSGLIIDFRANLGGNMFLSNPALSLLFPDTVKTINFLKRSRDRKRNSFTVDGDEAVYVIRSNRKGYQKPIAVLTGPGAVSSGDQVALRMKFHPKARLFGKPTWGAFSAADTIEFGNPDWSGRVSAADCFLVSEPDQHLTRRDLGVDFPVWLKPDDVGHGRDTVVEAAIKWIQGK